METQAYFTLSSKINRFLTPFLLRCPISSLPLMRLRQLSTAATRSPLLTPPQAALGSLPLKERYCGGGGAPRSESKLVDCRGQSHLYESSPRPTSFNKVNSYLAYSFPRGEAVTALAVTDEECGQKSYNLCAETDLFLTFNCRRSSSVFCHCLFGTMAKSTFPPGEGMIALFRAVVF